MNRRRKFAHSAIISFTIRANFRESGFELTRPFGAVFVEFWNIIENGTISIAKSPKHTVRQPNTPKFELTRPFGAIFADFWSIIENGTNSIAKGPKHTSSSAEHSKMWVNSSVRCRFRWLLKYHRKWRQSDSEGLKKHQFGSRTLQNLS